jgi:hypothetical protein
MLSVSKLHSADDSMINEYGAGGGMRIGRGNRCTRRKPAPVPFCPLKAPTCPDLEVNPDGTGENPVTNRLSCDMASSRDRDIVSSVLSRKFETRAFRLLMLNEVIYLYIVAIVL